LTSTAATMAVTSVLLAPRRKMIPPGPQTVAHDARCRLASRGARLRTFAHPVRKCPETPVVVVSRRTRVSQQLVPVATRGDTLLRVITCYTCVIVAEGTVVERHPACPLNKPCRGTGSRRPSQPRCHFSCGARAATCASACAATVSTRSCRSGSHHRGHPAALATWCAHTATFYDRWSTATSAGCFLVAWRVSD